MTRRVSQMNYAFQSGWTHQGRGMKMYWDHDIAYLRPENSTQVDFELDLPDPEC